MRMKSITYMLVVIGFSFLPLRAKADWTNPWVGSITIGKGWICTAEFQDSRSQSPSNPNELSNTGVLLYENLICRNSQEAHELGYIEYSGSPRLPLFETLVAQGVSKFLENKVFINITCKNPPSQTGITKHYSFTNTSTSDCRVLFTQEARY